MSLHSSLKSSDTMRRHRSVLSRLERIKNLKERGIFTDESSVLGLPKVRNLKFRVRKEKAAASAAAGTEAAPGAPAASTASGTAKAAPSKTAAQPKMDAGSSGKKKE